MSTISETISTASAGAIGVSQEKCWFLSRLDRRMDC